MKALLFTDIVESTVHNSVSGDDAWLELLERHDNMAEDEVRHRGGRVIKRLGDGLLAIFDLASDALDTALAVTEGARELGIGVRASVHVAEVEETPDDVLGLGVSVAARVLGQADGGDVVTTRAVAELLAGSTFKFMPRGRHSLKGIDGEWEISSATRR